MTFSGSNSSSNSNGFYSEGLSSLGWTSLELDITANGTTTHHSVNPGNSIEFKNLAPGSTVTVTGTAVLPDGTVRNVKSDTYTVKKGENKLKLYCEYKYWLNGCKDSSLNGGPHTYMSNQSITLPVASDYTSGTNTYPFAGWIEYAPGLSTHGNYYRKGSNVPAGQVTGDVEFFADYGFALYKQTAGGTKTYIAPGAVQTVAAGGYLDLKAEDVAGSAVGITQITTSNGTGSVTLDSGKIKGVNVGTATVTYTGTTKYGAPFSVNVPVEVKPMSLQVKKSGSVITSYTQTKGDATQLTAEIVSDTPLPSGTIVNWTFDIPADTTIGFAANQYTTNTTTGSVSYTPSTSTLSYVLGMYKKADGTNLLGNLLPDTYSGTITVTAEFTLDGVPQSLSTDLVVTGYSLPTNPFAASVDATKTATMNMTSYGSGSSQCWIQNETGASNLCMYVSPAGLPSKSPDGAEWVWKFKLNNVDKSPTVTVNNDGSCTVPLTELGLSKTQGGTVLADWTMSYHGLKKSGSKSAVIRAAVPKIKLLVEGVTGCTATANGTTAYDITQTAAGATFRLKVVEDKATNDDIYTPSGTVGSPEFKITFVSNTNDYGITTKPNGYLLNTYNANISAFHNYPISTGFGLGLGDSATITISVTYKVYGITKTAAITTLNIKGTSTPAAGMYYYSDGTVSSTKKTSGTVAGIVVSASGTTARILDPTNYPAAKWCTYSMLACDTSGQTDGNSAYGSWDLVLGLNHDDYPVMNTAKTKRTSTGINWFVPTVNELQTLYSLVSVIDPALTAMGAAKLTDTNYYWSSTTAGSTTVKGVFFNAGSAGNYSSYDFDTAKPFRLMADVPLTP